LFRALIGGNCFAVELLLGAQLGLRQSMAAHGAIGVHQCKAQLSGAEAEAAMMKENQSNSRAVLKCQKMKRKRREREKRINKILHMDGIFFLHLRLRSTSAPYEDKNIHTWSRRSRIRVVEWSQCG